MNWLHEAITDSTTKKSSSKRICMLVACFALALATVALAGAACLGYDTASALTAVSIPLAGLGGYSYTNGKKNELNASRVTE